MNKNFNHYGEFLFFKWERSNPKTEIWTIHSKSGGCLGSVVWYPNWRKYVFFPNTDTIWDQKCLSEITVFLEKVNKNHKQPKLTGDEGQ